MRRHSVARAGALAALGGAAAAAVLSNVVPRTSTDGAIMDAHDGNVLAINSTYFWYAAGYGFCRERDSNVTGYVWYGSCRERDANVCARQRELGAASRQRARAAQAGIARRQSLGCV